MSSGAAPRWAGALQIIRFNWPDYVFALAVGTGCLAVVGSSVVGRTRWLAICGLAAVTYLVLASLLASHWIYDRSPLAHWRWLPEWLPSPPGRWMLIQTGFDSTHGRVAHLLPPSPLPVLDLYGTLGVDGASVRRARTMALKAADELPPTVTALPSEPAAADALLAIFALHEIRDRPTREDFFRAVTNALAAGGKLLLVEHLRDWKNFIAFGPGFVHFLSEAEWRRCAAAAGLKLERTSSITPFVRVFLWVRP